MTTKESAKMAIEMFSFDLYGPDRLDVAREIIGNLGPKIVQAILDIELTTIRISDLDKREQDANQELLCIRNERRAVQMTCKHPSSSRRGIADDPCTCDICGANV